SQGKRLGRFGNYPREVTPFKFSSDSTRLIVDDEVNQLFCEWDLKTFQQTRTFRSIDIAYSSPSSRIRARARFSDDLRWFLSATSMGDFSLEESGTGRTIRRNLDLHNVLRTVFSPDGKRFAAA